MRITKVVVVTLTAITFLLLTVVGCVPLSTETYTYTDFTRVEVGYGFQVKLVQSNEYSISVTAPTDSFNLVQVSKEGETLIISLTETFRGSKKAEITMPNLYQIKLSGGTRADLNGFSSSQDLKAELSGGSRMNGDMAAGDADFILSGGSHMSLSGSADNLDVNVSGGSHLTLTDFSVSNADVSLSGGSHAVVNVDGTLDVDLSGGSDLRYTGQPTLGSINKSDGSSIRGK
jgi:hypothetical protein